MLHLCVFGGHGGEIRPGKRVYFTVFGGCELHWPTLARQVISARQRGEDRTRRFGAFIITAFGATVVKSPTLAQEFLEMQDALRSGLLTLSDCDRAQASLADSGAFGSFTIFGACDTDALPSEAEELDSLALHRHLGHISDSAANQLMLAAGETGAQRIAVVRRAVATA
jgi:hypothetical protein